MHELLNFTMIFLCKNTIIQGFFHRCFPVGAERENASRHTKSDGKV